MNGQWLWVVPSGDGSCLFLGSLKIGRKGDIDVPQFEDIVRGISSSVLGLSRVNIPFLFFCSANSLPSAAYLFSDVRSGSIVQSSSDYFSPS
ncbi:hypothetical protein SUGI_0619360 [Cryptomeria japonica]|nr:hypothetical protein SUGI_0619360 [Cryptomeria japonica]